MYHGIPWYLPVFSTVPVIRTESPTALAPHKEAWHPGWYAGLRCKRRTHLWTGLKTNINKQPEKPNGYKHFVGSERILENLKFGSSLSPEVLPWNGSRWPSIYHQFPLKYQWFNFPILWYFPGTQVLIINTGNQGINQETKGIGLQLHSCKGCQVILPSIWDTGCTDANMKAYRDFLRKMLYSWVLTVYWVEGKTNKQQNSSWFDFHVLPLLLWAQARIHFAENQGKIWVR